MDQSCTTSQESGTVLLLFDQSEASIWYGNLLNYEEFGGMTYTVGSVLMCTLRENYRSILYHLTGVRNRPFPPRPIRGQYLITWLFLKRILLGQLETSKLVKGFFYASLASPKIKNSIGFNQEPRMSILMLPNKGRFLTPVRCYKIDL